MVPRSSLNRIGSLLPRILCAAICLEIASKALPPEILAHRTWEPLILFATGPGPCRPNQRIVIEEAHGDLPVLGNAPELIEARRESASTDSHGFRNPPVVPAAAPVVVVGDSFAAGASLSDEDVFSTRLWRDFGIPSFNAGGLGFDPDRIPDVRGKLLLVLFFERTEAVGVIHLGAGAGERGWPRLVQGSPITGALSRMGKALGDGLSYSPVRILARRCMRSFEDDRWLPNQDGSKIVKARTRSGRRIAFLRYEVELASMSRDVDVSPFVDLRRWLAAREASLAVVLIPSKLTVYRDLLEGSVDLPGRVRSNYLQRVGLGLERASIPVVDLTEELRKAAVDADGRKELVYWADDTHWNPRGVGIAARVTALELRARGLLDRPEAGARPEVPNHGD